MVILHIKTFSVVVIFVEGKRALRSSRILNECNLSCIACVADALNLRYIQMDHTNGLDKCVGQLQLRLVLYYYSVKKTAE